MLLLQNLHFSQFYMSVLLKPTIQGGARCRWMHAALWINSMLWASNIGLCSTRLHSMKSHLKFCWTLTKLELQIIKLQLFSRKSCFQQLRIFCVHIRAHRSASCSHSKRERLYWKKVKRDINPEVDVKVCEVVINKIIQVLLPPCVARALWTSIARRHNQPWLRSVSLLKPLLALQCAFITLCGVPPLKLGKK